MIGREWTHAGLKCAVKSSFSAGIGSCFCGYVCVSKKHPLYKKDCSSDECADILFFGGIDYSSHDLDGDKKGNDEWWLGFDMVMRHFNLDEVVDEINKLAEKLAKISNK